MIYSARLDFSGTKKIVPGSMTLKLAGAIAIRLFSVGYAVLLVCGIASAQALHKSASTGPDKPTAKLRTVSFHKSKKSSRKSSRRGQQKIDPVRSREIQEALIREHYLDGTASGTWDARSQSAMERYQADNGWQHKTVPDSRALIKLGLGPDHEHLLNPESAMTSQSPPHAAPISTQAPTSDSVPVNQPQR